MHNGFEDLDLDRLRRRRSEKWRMHPPDVLPAFIGFVRVTIGTSSALLSAIVDRMAAAAGLAGAEEAAG